LGGAFRQAVRWRWVAVSPMGRANPPAAPRPNPRPPSSAEAAKILAAAFAGPDRGTLVWVAMTTGARRGEPCALRWSGVDLESGVIGIHKETNTLLREHLHRCQGRAEALGLTVAPDAFMFSLRPYSVWWSRAGSPRVTWVTDYSFSEPLRDVRSEAREAEQLHTELLREMSEGRVLHGSDLRVVARTLPQDEVIVEATDGRVALVHLTWSGHAESPPWPTTDLLTSAAHLEQTIEFRY
jgi:integrase